MAVVFTWEYLETPSEQSWDELISDTHSTIPIFSFEGPSLESAPKAGLVVVVGAKKVWLLKTTGRQGAATNGFFRNFWKGTTKNLKNF